MDLLPALKGGLGELSLAQSRGRGPARAVGRDLPARSVAQAVPHMPSVGDLNRVRQRVPHGLRVGGRAVPCTRPRLPDASAANRPPPRRRVRAGRRSGHRCRRRSPRWRSRDICAGRNRRFPALVASHDPVTGCPAGPARRCPARLRSRAPAATGRRPCRPARARHREPAHSVARCVVGIARSSPVPVPGTSVARIP